MPKAVGTWITLRVPEPLEESSGGIVLPDETRKADHLASQVAVVYDVGPWAYKDPEFHGPNPWVKRGDIVIIHGAQQNWKDTNDKRYKMADQASIKAICEPHDVADRLYKRCQNIAEEITSNL